MTSNAAARSSGFAPWRDTRQPAGERFGEAPVRSLLEAAGITRATDPDAIGGTPPRPVALPLGTLFEATADGTCYYTASTTDDRGRLTDRAALRLLHWGPGTPTTIGSIPHAGVLVVRSGGPAAVTSQGFLHLPPEIRHDCRIHAGQRLLVAARPDEDLLVLYSPWAVDAMTRAYHAAMTYPARP